MLQPRGLAHPLSTHMSISSSVGTYLQVWILAVRAGGTSDPASSPVPVVEIFQFWGGLTRHWEEPPPHEGWPGPSRHAGSALGHWGARFTGEMSQIVFALSGWVLTVSCVSVTGHSVWTELNCSQSALVPPCLPSLQASRPLQPGRPRSNPLATVKLLPAPACSSWKHSRWKWGAWDLRWVRTGRWVVEDGPSNAPSAVHIYILSGTCSLIPGPQRASTGRARNVTYLTSRRNKMIDGRGHVCQ